MCEHNKVEFLKEFKVMSLQKLWQELSDESFEERVT